MNRDDINRSIVNGPLLQVRRLTHSHLARRTFSRASHTVDAFKYVNLTIHRGKTLGLVGESGAGKSSLARSIALLDCPTAGAIDFDGTDLLSLSKKELLPYRRRIQMIFQDPASALNPAFTAREIVAEPLLIQQLGTRAEQTEKALHAIEQVGLDPRSAGRRPAEFSGGQRQRLAIARALVLNPGLLVLDEALSNLDARNQDLVLALLSDLQASHGLSYLFVAHDLGLVSRIADDVAVMYQGQIVEQQPTTAIFAAPHHAHTRDLVASAATVEQILMERSA